MFWEISEIDDSISETPRRLFNIGRYRHCRRRPAETDLRFVEYCPAPPPSASTLTLVVDLDGLASDAWNVSESICERIEPTRHFASSSSVSTSVAC